MPAARHDGSVNLNFVDLVAGVAALILITTVAALAILGRPGNDLLTGAVGAAIGWIFRAGANHAATAIQARRQNGG